MEEIGNLSQQHAHGSIDASAEDDPNSCPFESQGACSALRSGTKALQILGTKADLYINRANHVRNRAESGPISAEMRPIPVESG